MMPARFSLMLRSGAALVLLMFTGLLLALTPLGFFGWSQVGGNGSHVELNGAREAVFVIRRTNSGPKRDPDTHGYAYLLSPPINLPAQWRSIQIRGVWWREPAARSNYPELALRVHARYPLFAHGNERYGRRDANFLHIGIRSWRPSVYFLEEGADGTSARSSSRKARFPDAPRAFMLVITRDNDGRVGWSYFESERGRTWREVFRNYHSRLFDGTDARRIFIKLGGWNTWEYPVTNRLHVRDLEIEVSTWRDDDLPGNFDLNELNALKDRPQRTLQAYSRKKRRQHLEEGSPKTDRMEQASHCDAPPYVLNASENRYYNGLQEALDAARPGAVIKLGCGVYHGHFHIRKQVTLESADGQRSAILDGGGTGIVLRVDGKRAVVRKLEVRNSGIDDRIYLFWLGSGILVTAPEVRLDSLLVRNNGNGISARGAIGLRITNSEIRHNRFDGISFEGVRKALVRNVRVQNNGGGILVTRLVTLPGNTWPRDLAKLSRIQNESRPSSRVIITHNRITGNGSYGIAVSWYSHHCTISHNTVDNTGLEVKPDFAPEKRFFEFYTRQTPWPGMSKADYLTQIRQVLAEDERDAATGILLSCEAHDNEVVKNIVVSNAGDGVTLFLVNNNRVKRNLIRTNRTGVLIVSGSRSNRVFGNRIQSNRDHGVAIGDYLLERAESRPTRNVIARNDIQNNVRGDALDVSTTVYSPRKIEDLVRKRFGSLADKMSKYPTLQRSYQDYFKPGKNDWDDGRLGNHYGDFDEAAEGFRDENGDGISEVPHAIPGGSAVDAHPLNRARGQEETASVPDLPASLAR